MSKFFVITGEASGDLHASFLIKEIKKILPESRFYGVGGKRMKKEGVELFFHIDKLSIIGFWEVLKKMGSIRRILRSLVEKMRSMKPDVLILVDSPGFNLRLAPFAKSFGIKVIYYITPQVWAWGAWRLRGMYKNLDIAIVIFPFEKKLLSSYGIKTYFVGHPLSDEIKLVRNKGEFCRIHRLNPAKPIVALLPGSRKEEIKRLLPLMLKCARTITNKKQDTQFILPTISGEIETMLSPDGAIKVIFEETPDSINCADVAIAASGTVTLESVFLETPCVIIYKVSLLSYIIGKRLVKLPFIGLVNIIGGKEIVPEYIQFSIRTDEISNRVLRILDDRLYSENIKKELSKVKMALNRRGASKNAAEIIASEIRAIGITKVSKKDSDLFRKTVKKNEKRALFAKFD